MGKKMRMAKILESITIFDSENVSFRVYMNGFPSMCCSFQRFPGDLLLFPYQNWVIFSKALRWGLKKERPMCPGKKCNYTDLIVLVLSFSVLLKQQVCVFSLMLGSDGKKRKRNPLETSSEISGGWDTSPFLPLLLSYFLVNLFVALSWIPCFQ